MFETNIPSPTQACQPDLKTQIDQVKFEAEHWAKAEELLFQLTDLPLYFRSQDVERVIAQLLGEACIQQNKLSTQFQGLLQRLEEETKSEKKL